MIKVSLIMLLGLTACALLRRRSAALRHLVLATAVVGAAVAPGVELLFPAWDHADGRCGRRVRRC